MQARVVVLGAGFGGLELATVLSEEFGDGIDVTLVDASDAFVFGYSKLDVMFGRTALQSVRLPYRDIDRPGVRFLQEKVTAIDPAARRVTTDAGVHEADFLVIALGADYDTDATPGLDRAGHEFYSVGGAARCAELLDTCRAGRIVIGVCGTPYKCPPAPTETALLLHDHLVGRGLRDTCEISFVIPMDSPVPPSPETSHALVAALAERDIALLPSRRVMALDPARRAVTLDDGTEMPFDLFLGVPRHRAPAVVVASGLTEGDFVPVDPTTLETRASRVYAIGDVANVGVPKAGVFAEGQARVLAAVIGAAVRGDGRPPAYDGRGSCYIEFGGGRVGRVDVDFLSGPGPTGVFHEPTVELAAEKHRFGSTRRARWFGIDDDDRHVPAASASVVHDRGAAR